jgi:hypothetical protein
LDEKEETRFQLDDKKYKEVGPDLEYSVVRSERGWKRIEQVEMTSSLIDCRTATGGELDQSPGTGWIRGQECRDSMQGRVCGA